VAYQGFGRGLDVTWIHDVNARVTAGLTPDLVLLLDLDPAVGLARAAARGRPDRLEAAALDFHLRVRDGFHAQADAEPERWRRLRRHASTRTRWSARIWRRGRGPCFGPR
jgi:dTMP kinase